jgi:hypothetical protein
MVQPTILEYAMSPTTAHSPPTFSFHLALTLLLAASALVLVAPAARAQTDPRFTQPSRQTAVQVGQPVTFAGTGCPPGAPVTVGERTTTAADDGSFSVTLVFPAGAFDTEVPADGIEDVREFLVEGACGGEAFASRTLVPARATAQVEQVPTRIAAGGGGTAVRGVDLTGSAAAIGVAVVAGLLLAAVRRCPGGDAGRA